MASKHMTAVLPQVLSFGMYMSLFCPYENCNPFQVNKYKEPVRCDIRRPFTVFAVGALPAGKQKYPAFYKVETRASDDLAQENRKAGKEFGSISRNCVILDS